MTLHESISFTTRYITHGSMHAFVVHYSENIYSTSGCTMLMVHPRLFSPNERMSKMNKWANEQSEQMSKHFYSFKKMSKHFYSFKKMSKHFYYKMSKWVNEQNAHISKFGVKWTPEVLSYYKNTPGCTMSELHYSHHKEHFFFFFTKNSVG